jgi:hypothetical protein
MHLLGVEQRQVEIVLAAEEQGRRLDFVGSSRTAKSALPSGDQRGWTTLRSSSGINTFAAPPAAGIIASGWTAYAIFFGSPEAVSDSPQTR